jgi:transposase-like protein
MLLKMAVFGNGKPKFKCKTCGRQFVENPQKKPISDDTKQLYTQAYPKTCPRKPTSPRWGEGCSMLMG